MRYGKKRSQSSRGGMGLQGNVWEGLVCFLSPFISLSALKRGFGMEGRGANIGLVHRDVLRVISRRGSLVVVCGGVLSREWEDTYRGFLEGWLERGDGEGALIEEEVNVVN